MVRTRTYVVDMKAWPEIARAHAEAFASVLPAATMVQVAALIDPDLLVEIEADAFVPQTPGAVSFGGPGGVGTMQKITPFLWFDGQAEHAARFYVSLLPDSRIDRVTRSPADTPSGPAGMVLTVEFTLAGTRFIALNGGPHYRFTEAFSIQIACADQAEVDRLWTGPDGRRVGGALRLPQGPLGVVLAGRARPSARVDGRPRPRSVPAGDGGDAADEQARHRRARAGRGRAPGARR